MSMMYKLLSLFCLMLFKQTGALPGHLQHLQKYEVVKPIQVETDCEKNCDSKREYIIPTRSKRYHISLQQHSSVHANSEVFAQSKDGLFTKLKQNNIQSCHYRGTLKNGQGNVILTTCKGLHGVVIDEENNTYIIEPTGSSNDHVIYEQENRGDKKLQDTVKRNIRVDWTSDWLYVSMAIVADHSFYNMHKNISVATAYVISLVNYMNFIYEPIKLKIILSYLELWTHSDVFHVEKDSLSSNVQSYNVETLIGVRNWKHKNFQFLTGRSFGELGGLGSVSSICNGASDAFSVATNPNPHLAATIVAHEFGHNMGFGHDYSGCVCPHNAVCLMTTHASLSLVTALSDCTITTAEDKRAAKAYECLKNVPEEVFSGSKCGNYAVEDDEECDCGPNELCTSTCCDARTCMLLPDAQCDQGTCCNTNTCQFSPAATICRGTKDVCDLPDRCTGDDGFCPVDVFKADYTSCNEGYCLNGKCAESLTGQCQMLWGPNADKAVHQCYQNNKQGNSYTNCGKKEDGTFIPCEEEDIYCGRLVCAGDILRNSPLIGGGNGAMKWTITIGEDKQTCRVPVGMQEDDDPSYVKEGTKCGENKLCHHSKCIHKSPALSTSACDGLCKDGVCTNIGACFCHAGYAGITCDRPADVKNAENTVGKVYYPLCFGACATGTCDVLTGKCICPPGRACPDCTKILPRSHAHTFCAHGAGIDCGDVFSGAYTASRCACTGNLAGFTMLKSFRDLIVWKDMDNSAKKITCECARLARDEGYASFGIKYYAECWASTSKSEDLTTDVCDCINTTYKQCGETDETCVGTEHSIFIYNLHM